MRRLSLFSLILAAALSASACAKAGGASPTSTASEAAPAPVPGKVTTVDAKQFQSLIVAKKALVVDVRTPGEVARGHLPDATPINVNDARFAQKIALLPKDKAILVYCASGHRSAAAASAMAAQGFAEVYNLDGGIGAWMSAGLPVERSADAPAPTGEHAMTPAALDAILKAPSRVLVDYHTPWCTPCRKMAPLMGELAQTWAGRAQVVLVDVEQSEALATREKVQGVPVFVLYIDGKERWRASGEQTKDALTLALNMP